MINLKITVALTTYNRPEYLKLAIDGILSQSFREFEFLILDNGSEHETEEVIKSYNDKRIRYVRNEINSREFINVVWDLAHGEYLIITHDDDIMKEDMLKRQIEILDNYPDVIGVSCNCTSINKIGEIIKEKIFALDKALKINKFEYGKYYFSGMVHIVMPTLLMRKAFFIENNLRFELQVGPGADTYLYLKANLLPSAFYIINEPLYYYRVHNNQDSIVNNVSLKLDLYEGLLDLYEKAGYMLHIERITDILLRDYVKNYYFNLITKEIFVKKIDSLALKLKQMKQRKKMIIQAYIFKNFTFILFAYYSILIKKRVGKSS